MAQIVKPQKSSSSSLKTAQVEKAAFKGKLLDCAERYTRHGLRVLPLPHKTKSPHMKNWPERASNDYATVKNWIQNGYPQKTDGTNFLEVGGLGIATGQGSGIIVLDVDGEEGKASLAALLTVCDDLPITPTQKTPGGGLHAFFKARGPCKNGVCIKGFKGLDIRADGGQVVVAPSIHPNGGTYEWVEGKGLDDCEIAEFPLDLWEFISDDKPKEKQEQKKTLSSTVGEIIPKGSRNQALASLAGTMRNRGMTADEIEAALLKVNQDRCEPPLDDNEVKKIALSIGSKPAGKTLATVTTVALEAQPGLESIVKEFDSDEVVEEVKFAAGLFPMKQLSIISSPPGLGKSFFIQRIATDLSNGGNVLEGFHNSDPMKVLVFAGEGGGEQMILRGKAANWAARKENFIIVDAIPATIKGFSLMLNEPQGQGNISGLVEKYSPQVVFFDSLVSFHSADESDYKSITPVLTWLLQLARSKGIAVVLVHHQRKPKRSEQKVPASQDDIIGSSVFARLAAACFKLEAVNPQTGEILGSSPEGEHAIKVSCTKTWYKKPRSFIFQIQDGCMKINLYPHFDRGVNWEVYEAVLELAERRTPFKAANILELRPNQDRNSVSRGLKHLTQSGVLKISGKNRGATYTIAEEQKKSEIVAVC